MFLARALDRQNRSVRRLPQDRTYALGNDPVVTLQVGERHLALGGAEGPPAGEPRAADPRGADNLLIEVDLAEGKTMTRTGASRRLGRRQRQRNDPPARGARGDVGGRPGARRDRAPTAA